MKSASYSNAGLSMICFTTRSSEYWKKKQPSFFPLSRGLPRNATPFALIPTHLIAKSFSDGLLAFSRSSQLYL